MTIEANPGADVSRLAYYCLGGRLQCSQIVGNNIEKISGGQCQGEAAVLLSGSSVRKQCIGITELEALEWKAN